MDVDRPSWGSTLMKNHDENKTYILVKLSESFSNAIQEYSAAQNQSTNSNHTNNNNNIINNNNSKNTNSHHHHHNHRNGSITAAAATTTTTNNHNHKRPKLHHNNSNDNNNSNNHANRTTTNQQQTAGAPTIKFHGTRGAIRFPNGKSYDFSLEQSDNSVECIKQTKNRWESVGKMACCLHVKCKDDVYQRTRTKMEAAEQEKRKYCTKLLGSPENNSTSTATTLGSTPAAVPPLPHHHHQQQQQPPPPPPSITTTITTTTTTNNTTTTAKSNKLLDNTTTTKPSDTKSSLISSSSSSSSSSHHTNVNLSKYPDITDVKQLKKYKADFDKDFKEYQNLHGYLHRIEERFKKLRESLKQSAEGSPEWESAKEQIFNEYERVKGDSNFHRARSKYKQLYDKLAHIKEKIFQFKRQQRDKCNKKRK